MSFGETRRWGAGVKLAITLLFTLSASALALLVNPGTGLAQDQECADCLYAVTELNLRQEPSLDATVLRFVPQGAPVLPAVGGETNGYIPVTYDSVPGWVVALGLVTSPEEVEAVGGPAPVVDTAPTVSDDARVTLSPLLLRDGPSADAAPILTMPEGEEVTLTREGAENGYVTVDYGGVTGWAYAELLGGES
jgi:uncharacterized protein YgiM (DUF1202 family)